LRLLLVGPPGAGKGTQAAMICAKLGIPHISTGDMFRKAIKEGTKYGKKAKEYIEAGQLVPDSITVEIVKERLKESDCSLGFLLDGFPRTVAQAEALDKILEELGVNLDKVINIELPDAKILDRLTGRRTCPKCGATYHIKNNPPSEEGKCDECGSDLIQRSDDTEATVKSRLEVYHEETAPVIAFYESKNLVCYVDGDQPISQVLTCVGRCIGRDL